MKVTLSNTSFSKKDNIKLYIDFESDLDLLKKVTNISINISRIDKQRNHFVLGFGSAPDISSSIAQASKSIPDNWEEGLYLISSINLITAETPEGNIRIVPRKDIPDLFFWYSGTQSLELVEHELTDKINQLNDERGRFMNTELISSNVTDINKATSYKVMIFAVGCLVHSPQIMKGYTLHPLDRGYDYSHMLDAVNSFVTLKHGITLEPVESIKHSFSSSTPLFVIEYINIKAIDHIDAGKFCTLLSEKIFTILAYEKGQRPSHFASLIVDSNSNESWQAFHFPGYRGNLVSDFNPSSTADALERILPKIDTSPWIDLLMRTYADAESEQNSNYACLKFWSILEMVAKKEVTDNNIELSYPNGDAIYDFGGNVVKTKSALGKVYKHVLDSGVPSSIISNGENGTKLIFESYDDAEKNPNFDEKTTIIKLWETMSALYEIRNSTAHSGKFDYDAAKTGNAREQLAAKLWELEYQTFLREIRNILKFIVSKELNNA